MANYSNAQVELDPSQTYNTGNIVVPTTTTSGSTWVGGVYQDGVNCMGGGGPGYCGPNPIVRPDGNINFSYGSVYLYQEQLTAGLLPSITGLQIRGYDFSFTAKNGNSWDDGRVDQLSALVRFWDTTTSKGSNNLVYGNSWNLSYQFDWTNFTFSETFASPYDANSIGRVQYGFIGKDNNFWAGHYGPEIGNVSFNIRYGVDPCVADPLFSTSCSGYLTALQSLVPDIGPTTEVVATQPEPVAEVQTVAALVPSTQQSASTQEPAQQQVATVEQKQEQSNEKKEGVSLSLVLSVLRQEQSRISSVEQSVVADSVSQALKELSQVSADAEAVAQQSSNQSQEQASSLDNQQAQQLSITTQQTSAQSFTTLSPNENRSNQQTVSIQASSQENIQFSVGEQTTIQFQQPTQDNSQQNNMSVGALEIKQPEPTKVDDTSTQLLVTQFVDQKPSVITQTQPIQQQEQTSIIPQSLIDPMKVETIVDTNFSVTYSLLPERRPQEEIELPKVEELKVGAKTPADDFLEPKTFTFDQNQSQTNDSVKKQSQTNELAVGVSFDSLATTPAGFGNYNIALKDAAFYVPKEIYKGQKTVDNARALRQLSSDKLHQEMVEQQYRR